MAMPRKQAHNLNGLMARFTKPFYVSTLGRRNMSSKHFFDDFFKNRNWDAVANFWYHNVRSSTPLITGDSKYGVTDMKTLEYSFDQQSSYRRFALRIGYVGTMYTAYQRSRYEVKGEVKVEHDLDTALGKQAFCQRMTKPNVSAISQIVTLPGTLRDTTDTILEKARDCLPVCVGRLAVYDCVNVITSFKATEGVTWRRFLYLFPLNEGEFNGVDIDVDFVNKALKRIEHMDLNYGPLSVDKNHDKNTSIIYRARASVIDISCEESTSVYEAYTPNLFVMGTPHELSLTEDQKMPYNSTTTAMCVEIVGSRFLDGMVRMIVATAAGESVRYIEERKENILVDICISGSKDKVSAPLPRVGLCLGGVGYHPIDEVSLSLIESNNLANKGLSWTIGYSSKPPKPPAGRVR